MRYLFECFVRDLGLEIQWWTDEELNVLEINILERAQSYKRLDGSRYTRAKDKITSLWKA